MPAKKKLEVIMGNNNSSHLTKAEIKERQQQEINVPNDNVLAPSYLSDELKEEFDRLAKILIDVGIMTNLDSMSLARFIVAEHQYEKVTIKMLNMKVVNAAYKNCADLQDKFFKQARASASDLGLTISSRCKLVLPKENKEKNVTQGEKRFGDRI